MENRHRLQTRAPASARSVFNALDPLTGDGLAIDLDASGRLVARAIYRDGERVVILTQRGAAKRLAHALLAALGEEAAADRSRMVLL